MGLQATMQGDRLQIAIFGKRNAGKSSILNAVTGQSLAIVSETKGTTTDPVYKAMEILPLGPCMFIDTPGLDDKGELGKKRVEKAVQVLNRTDIALVVIDITTLEKETLSGKRGLPQKEDEIVSLIEEKKLPYCIILNKSDCIGDEAAEKLRRQVLAKNPAVFVNVVSTIEKKGLEELKESLVSIAPDYDKKLHIIGGLIHEGDTVVLVVPVDSAAPKGRLIMPQQQVIRDILDNHAVAVVTQVAQLAQTLSGLGDRVKLVVTDSQAFQEVDAIVPNDILLTSFSILFARHKGNLKKMVQGVKAVDSLQDGDKVLIAEGCTHHRQCEDIGTVKLPRWLQEYTKKELSFTFCSGTEFPEDLSSYAMVLHCGGCMLNEREVRYRMKCASDQGIPMTNYGVAIAHVHGILKRSISMFPHLLAEFSGR